MERRSWCTALVEPAVMSSDLNDRVAFEDVKGPWGRPAECLREQLCCDLIQF